MSLSYQFLFPPPISLSHFSWGEDLLPHPITSSAPPNYPEIVRCVKIVAMHPPDDDDDLLPARNPSSRFRNLPKLNFFSPYIQYITPHHIAPIPFLFCPTSLISPFFAETGLLTLHFNRHPMLQSASFQLVFCFLHPFLN